MAKIKSFSEIVNNMIDRLRISQPNLDTKIGSVSRDLFIDIQADELQKIYGLISLISEKQSFATATGRDLDLIARNFGISRNSGSLASGIIVFTTSSLNNDITIPEGTEVSTRSGVSFRTIGSYVMSPSQRNTYASNASRLRSSLNKAGISDIYAIEVPIQATSRGSASNISSFQISQNDGPLDLNAINTQATSGGVNAESDSTFRARIFSLFNGSNTGTSIGFRNAAIGTNGVVDALVVEPGSSLMLRDGSEVIKSGDGNLSVVNSGTGGKVDIYILGSKLTQITESFSFRDKSSNDNISDDKNDLILGYSNQDLTKTNLQRRKDAFSNGNFPLQPVNSIVSVQGSLSGILTEGNDEKSNFILVKDLNPDTGGSPFGQDRIKFISNKKYVEQESISKSNTKNGDNIKFFNIKSFDGVYQDILLQDEVCSVNDYDRSKISLRNKNIISISSIRNMNTGEQYSYSYDNFENRINESGILKISGVKLPTKGEVVSATYTSRFFFDENINFQSFKNNYFYNKNISDKIYWASNDYIEEESVFERNSDDSNFQITVSENIEDVINVYSKQKETVQVYEDEFGKYFDLSNGVKNIINIIAAGGIDIYFRNEEKFSIKNMRVYMQETSLVSTLENVEVHYNLVDYFNINVESGSFYEKTIVLPSDQALSDAKVYYDVSSKYNSASKIYINYVCKKGSLVTSESILKLPIYGIKEGNSLYSKSGERIADSYNPVDYFYENNLASSIKRFSPSYLSLDLSSAFPNGIIRINGETLTKVTAQIPGSFFDGSKFDLSQAIKNVINKNYIPNTVSVAKVSSVSVDEKSYDLLGYSVYNNIFDKKVSKSNTSLNNYEFMIPESSNNSSISFSSGSTFIVEFYIKNENDFEDIRFISNGKKYTYKIYSRINSIEAVSGFRNQQGSLDGIISLSRFDKPESGTTYLCDYSFKAPIDGERITVNYTINSLIIEASTNIESVRPITSDVLVKEAESLKVDCSLNVVVSDDLSESYSVVIENVQNEVTNILSSAQLGGSISASEIISSASAVYGVDAVSLTLFCESGNSGRLSFVKALDNQSISPGSIEVNKVSRRNFE